MSVAKELLKAKHKKPKSLNEVYVSVGGEDEAYLYWKTFGKYWKRAKSAKKLLDEVCSEE